MKLFEDTTAYISVSQYTLEIHAIQELQRVNSEIKVLKVSAQVLKETPYLKTLLDPYFYKVDFQTEMVIYRFENSQLVDILDEFDFFKDEQCTL